jgi:purine-binding chemotaxis protein CheW
VNTPSSTTRLAILKRRAQILAESVELERRDESLESYVVLEIGTERAGISLSAFDEIAPLTPITELPGLPDWLAGLAQVRGRIVPVLDLHGWLKMAGRSSPRYLAIVRGTSGPMAILVDAVSDVRDIGDKDIAESLTPDRARGLRAITKDLVTLLDVEALLNHPDMIVDHRTAEESA